MRDSFAAIAAVMFVECFRLVVRVHSGFRAHGGEDLRHRLALSEKRFAGVPMSVRGSFLSDGGIM